MNRTDGDKRRNGHGSALIAVFYDFKVSPVLQEDTGTTYIRQRNDGSDRKDSFVSSITNNSPQNVNAEYTAVLRIRFHIPVILMEVLPIQWDIL